MKKKNLLSEKIDSEQSFEEFDSQNFEAEPATSRPIKEWSARISLILFGLIIGLVLLEVAFRMFPVKFHSANAPTDRPRNFYYPETATTSRDFSYSYAKPDNTFRMAVIGDSFTFGTGMMFDDTFPKRLERFLNLNKSNLHAEVHNLGVPGYSTAQQILLARRALRRGADLIVLQVTLNDAELQPYHATHPWVGKHGEIKLTHPIFNYWKSLGFATRRVLNSVMHREFKEYFHELYRNPTGWQQFSQSFGAIKRLAEKKGVPVVAVVFPLFHYPLDGSYPFKDIHHSITQMLSERNIPWLDLLHRYHNLDYQRLQILPGKDAHPNEIAHRIAAEAIYRWLVKLSFVPTELVVKKESRIRRGDAGSLLKERGLPTEETTPIKNLAD